MDKALYDFFSHKQTYTYNIVDSMIKEFKI